MLSWQNGGITAWEHKKGKAGGGRMKIVFILVMLNLQWQQDIQEAFGTGAQKREMGVTGILLEAIGASEH